MNYIQALLAGVALAASISIANADTTNQHTLFSTEFPYETHRVAVDDNVNMAYVDIGSGNPILLLHGNPTSSYLWRNVIPHIEQLGRVIAIDLIGFGASDKPDIEYRFADHQAYLTAFIEALELKDVTLVAHDWGSALALDYATQNPSNVRGVALMEALLPPVFPFASFDDMGPIADLFRAFRDPNIGPEMLIENNFFIEEAMPGSILRTLSDAEATRYRSPFERIESRKPIWRFTQEVPIAGEPAEVEAAMHGYANWLARTEIPVLYLYAEPGLLNPPVVRDWMLSNVRNLETQYIGAALHYVQEDQPISIGRAIGDWGRRNSLQN